MTGQGSIHRIFRKSEVNKINRALGRELTRAFCAFSVLEEYARKNPKSINRLHNGDKSGFSKKAKKLFVKKLEDQVTPAQKELIVMNANLELPHLALMKKLKRLGAAVLTGLSVTAAGIGIWTLTNPVGNPVALKLFSMQFNAYLFSGLMACITAAGAYVGMRHSNSFNRPIERVERLISVVQKSIELKGHRPPGSH
jgi:hypothetical protein